MKVFLGIMHLVPWEYLILIVFTAIEVYKATSCANKFESGLCRHLQMWSKRRSAQFSYQICQARHGCGSFAKQGWNCRSYTQISSWRYCQRLLFIIQVWISWIFHEKSLIFIFLGRDRLLHLLGGLTDLK